MSFFVKSVGVLLLLFAALAIAATWGKPSKKEQCEARGGKILDTKYEDYCLKKDVFL